ELTVGASPPRHRDTRDLDDHHGQPRPSSDQPGHTLPGPTPFSYAGTDDGPGQPTPSLTQTPHADERMSRIDVVDPVRLPGAPLSMTCYGAPDRLASGV